MTHKISIYAKTPFHPKLCFEGDSGYCKKDISS